MFIRRLYPLSTLCCVVSEWRDNCNRLQKSSCLGSTRSLAAQLTRAVSFASASNMARTRSFVALAFALLGVAYAAASYDIHADHSSAKGFVEWAAARLVQELGALHESRGGDALGTWQDTNIEYCKLPPHLRLCHGVGSRSRGVL